MMGKGIRYNHVEKILKKHVPLGGTVLEIGCGGAVYKDLFIRYAGSDLPRNSYEESGDVNVYCDGQRLPFKKGSLDLIFMVACLYQIPDTYAVLNESNRVLKENGKLLIFDYNLKTTQRLKRLENNGSNQNHVWSPFKLASIVKKAGFNASIIYDYTISEPRSRWRRAILKMKFIKYMKFIRVQILRKEGWNIVIGQRY